MNRSYLVALLCFLCISQAIFSQSPPKKKGNITKLELVYKKALMEYQYSGGARSSFFVEYPYLRINDARPVAIDKHADILRNYYTKCPVADLHLDQMNQQIRRSKAYFWTGAGIAIVSGFTGMFAAASSDRTGLFYTGAGVAVGAALTGTYLAHLHMKRADQHLRFSVDEYNATCYFPMVKDTSNKNIAKTSKEPSIPSEKKYYQDTILYEPLRNDPSHSGLFGVTIDPVVIDAHFLNVNFGGGAGLFYTYNSLLGIAVDYRMAYMDDLAGHTGHDSPYGTVESYGIPSSYKRATQANLLAKFSVTSWEKDSKYHLRVGAEKSGLLRGATVLGRVEGTVVHAITVRAGYQLDQRIIDNDNGVQFTTTTPAYEYHYGSQVFPLEATNIKSSSAMQKSGIIVAGIGFSKFRDIKIKLQDEDYKGRREEKSQTDIYLDVLYAHNVTLQDMTYYHAVYPYSNQYGHEPHTLDLSSSPLQKIGARIAYQSITMYRPHFGLKTILEAGIRPGIKSNITTDNGYLKFGFGLVFGGRIATE